MRFETKEGKYTGLGVFPGKRSVEFTIACKQHSQCELVLVHKDTNEQTIILMPECKQKGSLRSIEVIGLPVKEYGYFYRVDGTFYMDPYATEVMGREIWADENRAKAEYQTVAGILQENFAWGMDESPFISKADMILYKLHVRNFSMGNKGNGREKGTFSAIRSKLDYFKKMGVTSLLLMPVYEFEEFIIEKTPEQPLYTKRKQKKEQPRYKVNGINCWGYGEGNYFSVKASYAKNPMQASKEFKSLVKSLHAKGMECILEFYVAKDTPAYLVKDALGYWVREYHVDGFSLIGAGDMVEWLVEEPCLATRKIFAEQISESMLVKHENLYLLKEEYHFMARAALNRLTGDVREFLNQQRKQSDKMGFINYLASNDGFTLADVFMYQDKHNEANGHENTDGPSWNLSVNFGIEGPSKKRYIKELRLQQWRNALAALYFAQGVPMLYQGDENGNSQQGNNNAYCQDNEIGWVNWQGGMLAKERLEYIMYLANLRSKYPLLSLEKPFRFQDYFSFGAPDLSFHGENAWIAEVSPGQMSVGMMYCGAYATEEHLDLYVAYNFAASESALALPNPRRKKWKKVFDSKEFAQKEEEILESENRIRMAPKSICVFVGE